MLNLFCGGCGQDINSFDLQRHTEKKISSQLSSQKDANYAFVGYSAYKPFSSFSNEKYIITLIGHILLKDNSQQSLTAQQISERYDKQGIDLISRLRGHFLLSIYNKNEQSCLVANDAMATLPLYYAHKNNTLFFANNMGVLSKLPPLNTSVNSQSIYNYIYFHMIPSPGTIYNEIKKLQPGQFILFKNNQLTIQTWWLPRFSEENTSNTAEYSQKIFNTLKDSVGFYQKQYDHYGAFLSGGLDSSAVSGMMALNSKKSANTFSIGFPVKEYNEIDYARLASSTFKTNQFEYFIQPEDISSNIIEIINHMDEPFGNSSVVPAYYCAKLAHENNITTLLAGDGGDELFAGNTRYSKQQLFERYFHIPGVLRKSFIEPIASSSLFNSNFLGHKIYRYVEQANIPLPDRLETYNFLFINSPDEVFNADFLGNIQSDYPIRLIREAYNKPEDASALNKMLYLDWKHTLADNDLQKVNMMCDLAGVNVAYPMLSNDMIDLSCQIPSKLKLTPTRLRYVYKEAMKGFLPDKIINKPKQGFGLPFGVWTRTEKDLQDLAYDSISSLKKHNIFNNQYLDDAIDKHRNEEASYYGELIWILMVLGLWFDKHQSL